MVAGELHAHQYLLDGGAAAPDQRRGEGRQGLRVALAVGEGLQDGPGRHGLRQGPDR
jgi:hypothetical protein